jgi:acetolactate synthase-1/2/3 large subunit
MILSKAYSASMEGARGPVLIEVPEDVWKERSSIDEEAFHFAAPTPTAPDEGELTSILEALTKARRPLVLAGAGIADAEAAP